MPKVTSTKPKKPSQSKKGSLLSQVVESKKKTSEKTAPAEEEDSAASASDAEEADGNGDHLHGFSTDEDSSDEEAVDEAEPDALEISKLPTFAKDDASVKRKLDQAKRTPVRLLYFENLWLSDKWLGCCRQHTEVSLPLVDYPMVSMKTN